jgi:tyrosine-protein phosphatase OCA6
MTIFPPHRFAMVQDGIYRGAYPTTRNVSFFRRLDLKTTISLCPSKPEIFESSNFHIQQENHHFKIKKPKESLKITLSEITKVLKLLLDKENYPIYIHCIDGTSVTNVFLMCFRKLKHWDMSSIINEATRFSKEDALEEIQFVESINLNDLDKDLIRMPEYGSTTNISTDSAQNTVGTEVVEVGLSRTILALDLEMGE